MSGQKSVVLARYLTLWILYRGMTGDSFFFNLVMATKWGYFDLQYCIHFSYLPASMYLALSANEYVECVIWNFQKLVEEKVPEGRFRFKNPEHASPWLPNCYLLILFLQPLSSPSFTQLNSNLRSSYSTCSVVVATSLHTERERGFLVPSAVLPVDETLITQPKQLSR